MHYCCSTCSKNALLEQREELYDIDLVKNIIARMKTQQAPLTDKKYIVPFILITLLFFLWGFARSILDVLNKHFQNELDISVTQSGMIQVTTYLGYFLMAIPAGLVINRWGYRYGVVLGLVIFGVGSLLFIPSAAIGTFHAFLVALFVIGCGLTFLETAANPYVTRLGVSETATSRLNLSQSFNGLGNIFATFLVGQFLFSEDEESGNVVMPYVVLGILVLFIALLFSRVQLPELSPLDDSDEQNGWKKLGELWKHKSFVLGLSALLAYEVAEISINSYFINFVTGQGWMTDQVASIVLTAGLTFFMVGRFGGSWLMRRVAVESVLLVCALGSVACMLLVLLNLPTISLVALIANYVFEAIMFPTIFSLALTGMGKLTKIASSLLMMTPIGGCGFLLMGYIADETNWVIPFVVPLVGYIVVLVFSITRYQERIK